MNMAADGGLGPHGPSRRRRVRGRIGTGLATIALILIVGSWIKLGTTSPIVTVRTGSMVPTLHIGDMALMESLHGRAPRVGEIVVAPVPLDVQQQLHYPASVTHRVVSVKNGMLTTKGDANAVEDPFSVPLSKVHIRVVRVIPGAGRFLRFMMSPFGIIWLVFGGVLFLGPKVLDLVRDGMVPVSVGTADSATLQQLVLAVNEYGQHLQSHTAIVQAMAEASRQLSAVTARLEAGSSQVHRAATAPAPIVRRSPTVLRAESLEFDEGPPADVLSALMIRWDPDPHQSSAGGVTPDGPRPTSPDDAPPPAPPRPVVPVAARTRRQTVARRPDAPAMSQPPRGVRGVEQAPVADHVPVVAPVPAVPAPTVGDAPALEQAPVVADPPALEQATVVGHPPLMVEPPSTGLAAVGLAVPVRAERTPPPWEHPPFAIRLPRRAGEAALVVAPPLHARSHTPPSEPPAPPLPAAAPTGPSLGWAGPRPLSAAVPWAGAPQAPLTLAPAGDRPPPWASAGSRRDGRAPWERGSSRAGGVSEPADRRLA